MTKKVKKAAELAAKKEVLTAKNVAELKDYISKWDVIKAEWVQGKVIIKVLLKDVEQEITGIVTCSIHTLLSYFAEHHRLNQNVTPQNEKAE